MVKNMNMGFLNQKAIRKTRRVTAIATAFFAFSWPMYSSSSCGRRFVSNVISSAVLSDVIMVLAIAYRLSFNAAVMI